MARKRVTQFALLNQSIFRPEPGHKHRFSRPVLVVDGRSDTPLEQINADFTKFVVTKCARTRQSPSRNIAPVVTALSGRPMAESVAWKWLLDEFLKDRPHWADPQYAELIQLGEFRCRGMARAENKKIRKERIDREAAEVRAKYAEERKANGGEGAFYHSGTWKKLRYQVLLESNGCCKLCGRSSREHGVILHVDHIKPRSRYPNLSLVKSNLQVLCADCNFGKRNHDTVDWSEGKVA